MVATGRNTVTPDKPSRNKNHDFKQQGHHRWFATVEPDAFHHKTYHLEPRWSMLVHALQRHGLSLGHQKPLNTLIIPTKHQAHIKTDIQNKKSDVNNVFSKSIAFQSTAYRARGNFYSEPSASAGKSIAFQRLHIRETKELELVGSFRPSRKVPVGCRGKG